MEEASYNPLSKLNHVRRCFNGGSEIFVLDTGAVIGAESEAMLQALHSRSTGGFLKHLQTLEEKGSDNFMKSFYVGYGHGSIGDCGDTTLFIEGVSMLAAKAFQDHPLYSGQEASTRYVDFSKQRFIDPTNSLGGEEMMESLREFYLGLIEPLREKISRENPMQEREEHGAYKKAVNAMAFDIARGFLPAGASTNLAWHSNLRQIRDRLLFLRHHPLEEIVGAAEPILDALKEAHPNSFGQKRYNETEEYQDLIAEAYYFHDSDWPSEVTLGNDLDFDWVEKYQDLFDKRPPKTELPKFLGQIGRVSADFRLDFGSFRDLHRHRALTQRMPLLTTEIGFNNWYLENLPDSLKGKVEDFLGEHSRKIEKLSISPENSQYFVPMGYNVSNKIVGDLPSMIYMVELRAKWDVHPTLDSVATKIGNYINDDLGIKVNFDSTPRRFNVKRGEHDIVLR